MITKIYKILYAGLMSCGVAAALTACTETWDDHYESLGDSSGMHEGSLWQAIKSNPNLSNFASVIEGCDFAKTLDGSQVFTVFAPTNDSFSQSEAQALIAEYKQQEAANVVEEDNTVLKEFIHNHVALYNYSVSTNSEDSITLLNGKYAVLKSDNIDGVQLLTKNQLYGNGVLYTINKPVNYLPSVFEYIRSDADLDSLRSFLYNSKFYYREFQPELSVPGSIVNGKTQYLDSVFVQRNELFNILGRIGTEDSSYIMVAPTNAVWRDLIEEYEPYFNYPTNVDKRDSLVYTNSRLAIVNGTTFSRTFNTDEALKDSAMSENSMKAYNYRKIQWGAPFEYYQYRSPLTQPYGALAQSEVASCSNGEVRKATQWNIDKQMTFFRYIIVEAESRNSIKEVSKLVDTRGDSIATISPTTRYVTNDNPTYYDKVWSNSFVEFVPNNAVVNHSVTFNLPNVLSNIGYDIYLVTAPALANDSNATDIQRLPTLMRCTISQPGQQPDQIKGENGKVKEFQTTPDAIDYFLVAENYKFAVCTYGIDDENLQTTLKVETRVGSTQVRNNILTRTMRIDCILLVPHGSLQLVDALPSDSSVPSRMWGTPGLLMYPHGQFTDRPFKWWYMQR